MVSSGALVLLASDQTDLFGGSLFPIARIPIYVRSVGTSLASKLDREVGFPAIQFPRGGTPHINLLNFPCASRAGIKLVATEMLSPKLIKSQESKRLLVGLSLRFVVNGWPKLMKITFSKRL
jgi:hypothetical protein